MKPARIAISPGHTPTAPGATRGKITEYGLSCAVIGDLIFRLDKAGHEAHLIGSGDNRVQAEKINKIGTDFGLELHFNSFSDPTWNGTEVLYSGSQPGGKLAWDICHHISERIGTRNRGVKIGYYQGVKEKGLITIIKNTNCPFVVVEPLFLSNYDDFSRIDIAGISIAIFDGVTEYWSGLG